MKRVRMDEGDENDPDMGTGKRAPRKSESVRRTHKRTNVYAEVEESKRTREKEKTLTSKLNKKKKKSTHKNG